MPGRAGFTLLEVLVAGAIAVILMAALYVALDFQLRSAADGREAVDQATLVRSIINRITNDLTPTLTPPAPKKKPVAAASGSTGAAGAAAGAAGAAAGAAGATGTTATGAATTDAAAVAANTTTPFQSGLIGDSATLTVFVSRSPNFGAMASDGTPNPSDVRRVSYWLQDDGLYRQEMPWVTSESVPSGSGAASDPDNAYTKLVAGEVTDLQFEYFDGSSWQSSWDGSTLSGDGLTPIGPPAAIRVHVWIKLPKTSSGRDEEPKEYRQVIAIPTAPGPAVPAPPTTPTGP